MGTAVRLCDTLFGPNNPPPGVATYTTAQRADNQVVWNSERACIDSQTQR